ncbi:Coiled-coil domain-containing protein 22-like protein [Frankliniella fusca]|uniref:Coiled-coil domain-containing protein 22 homolog n=1 Tax=Frankliniella fusca TaxID=407009 RepID=A0AAE1LDN2_9NEOP|nr:Coiled-coil domain-containing protein 22-like protein [Frankliniella fusca]
MDEVDRIIIRSLREIGCDIEEQIDCLKQFSTELVVEAAARCIEAIQPGSGIPTTLPPSMSMRFRIGAAIAQACTDMGYAGEVGYQTFLYSNEADLRRVLMFLIERLPKDGQTDKIVQEPTSRAAKLRKDISLTITKQLTSPWVPKFCREDGIRWHEDGSFTMEGGGSSPFVSEPLQTGSTSHSCTPQEWREYCVKFLPLVSEQVSAANRLIPSLITLNSRGILAPSQQHSPPKAEELRKTRVSLLQREFEKLASQHVESQNAFKSSLKVNSRFALSERLQFMPEKSPEKKKMVIQENAQTDSISETTEERQKRLEEEEELAVEKIKCENDELKDRIEQLQLDIKTLSAKLPQVMEERDIAERTMKDAGVKEALRRKVLDLLPEADTNITKLQALIEASTQKLVKLATQWEEHRAPLLQQYRRARQLNSSKASESARTAEALRVTREKVAELTEEVRNKEQLHSYLQAEYAKVSKDNSRSAYTRRIMEIIGNISKQKDEIDKILKDTKELHKEINSLAGRLDRSFTVADEVIFRDAKRDDVSRRAYKLLATLHSECSELVKMVEETGANVRESRDLEDQIETESAKKVSDNLERISADLRQMKQETASLAAQLKTKV